VPLAEIGAELLFQAIAERAEKAAVIVTTNLPFSEWTQVVPNARLCKALIDRITDRASIIETGTESYRFRRTLEKRRKESEYDELISHRRLRRQQKLKRTVDQETETRSKKRIRWAKSEYQSGPSCIVKIKYTGSNRQNGAAPIEYRFIPGVCRSSIPAPCGGIYEQRQSGSLLHYSDRSDRRL